MRYLLTSLEKDVDKPHQVGRDKEAQKADSLTSQDFFRSRKILVTIWIETELWL